jgi:hypothetical protein
MGATAVQMELIPEPVYRCFRCGGDFPRGLMLASRRTRTGVGTQCLGCRRVYQHRLDYPGSVEAVNHAVDEAPDHEPAVRLRDALEHHRRAGRPWSSAWPTSMSAAVRGMPAAEVISWRRVFNATRRSWAASYTRAGDAPGLSLTADDLEG